MRAEKINNVEKFEYAYFFEQGSALSALKNALEFAGDEGVIASAPEIAKWRFTPYFFRNNGGKSFSPFLDPTLEDAVGAPGWVIEAPKVRRDIWRHKVFGTSTEEYIVTDSEGNKKIVIVHGGGVFTDVERLEEAYSNDLLTETHAYILKDEEATALLEGNIRDHQIPIYSLKDLENGHGLPRRYGIILDLDIAQVDLNREGCKLSILKTSPLAIARVGGKANLEKFLNHMTKCVNVIQHYHPFNEINADIPQGRFVGMGFEGYDSLDGTVNLDKVGGRFVGVKPAGDRPKQPSFPF